MSVEATVSPPARPSERPHHPVRALLLAGGPRFVRDAFGPMLAFYLGWRLLGFDAGIAAATVLAIVGYAWERGQGRSGLSAAIGLGVAVVQAAAGLASTNTVAYFTPPLILNVAYGCAFLVSIFVGHPLAGRAPPRASTGKRGPVCGRERSLGTSRVGRAPELVDLVRRAQPQPRCPGSRALRRPPTRRRSQERDR